MIQVGNFNEFIVDRKSDLGYVLKNKDESVLLHQKQVNKELEIGSVITCFVQYDSKGRLCATLEEPTATIKTFGFAKVVEAKLSLGVFLSINTFKDVLLSKDYLPKDFEFWPQVGDNLPIKLIEKQGHLMAKLATRDELIQQHELKQYVVGEHVNATVVHVSNLAINAVTDEFNYVFISTKQFRNKVRLGSVVDVMVIGYHDMEIVGSLNKIKEEMVEVDEELIIKYLTKHGGKMPYTAHTDSKTIEEVFHMSRKSFKRALGGLYKERKIICNEYDTVLNEEK